MLLVLWSHVQRKVYLAKNSALALLPVGVGRGRKSIEGTGQLGPLEAFCNSQRSGNAYRSTTQGPFDQPGFLAAVSCAWAPSSVLTPDLQLTAKPTVTMEQLAFVDDAVRWGGWE